MITILMDFRVGVVKMKKNHYFCYPFLAFVSCAQMKNECIECHAGIKDIRDKNSGNDASYFEKS